MVAIDQARANYKAYMAADIEHMFRGAPAPVKADYGYSNGWIIIGDQSFCAEQMFPKEHHPRFPADQGLSD